MYFVVNAGLALAWAFINGEVTPSNLVAGFVLGYLMLVLTRRSLGTSKYVSKVPQVFYFFGYFLWQLLQSNVRVAYEVITPGNHMRPGIVAVDLSLERDYQIMILANLITLTPGTLSIDVSSDRKVLYVHSMYVDDPEDFRRSIKNGFEHRIMELFK